MSELNVKRISNYTLWENGQSYPPKPTTRRTTYILNVSFARDAITKFDNGAAAFSDLYDKGSLVDGKLTDVKCNVDDIKTRLLTLSKAVHHPNHIFTCGEAAEVTPLFLYGLF